MTPRPATSTLFPYTTLFRSTPAQGLPQILDSILHIIPGPDAFSGTPPLVEGYMIDSDSTWPGLVDGRSEEHTSELQSRLHLVCRLLLEKKKHGTSCSRSQPR